MTLQTAVVRGVYGINDVVYIGLSPSGTYDWEIWHAKDVMPQRSGQTTGTVAPFAAPVGGWKQGGYLVLMVGPGGVEQSIRFTVIDKTETRMFEYPEGSGQGLYGGNTYVQKADPYTRGVFGMTPVRIASDPDNVSLNLADAVAAAEASVLATPVDPARPTYQQVSSIGSSFGISFDWIYFPGPGGGGGLQFFPKTPGTYDGNQLHVAVRSGTGGTVTVQVYYGTTNPATAPLVETYANLSSIDAAYTAIEASPRILVAEASEDGTLPATTTGNPTTIGRVRSDQVATWVTTLRAAGVTHFEGPWNEPGQARPRAVAAALRAMAGAIRAADPTAKVLGPSYVAISRWELVDHDWLRVFMKHLRKSDGTFWIDGLGEHWYQLQGDLELTVFAFRTRTAILNDPTVDAPAEFELWQTEQSWFEYWQGRYDAHSAVAWEMMPVVVGEGSEVDPQNGRGTLSQNNVPWYDSDDYWPQALVTVDYTVSPRASAYRAWRLARWGRQLTSWLDFGEFGGRVLWGQGYHNASDNTNAYVVIDPSRGGRYAHTFNVTGPGTQITTRDAYWQPGPTYTVASGQVTVNLDIAPTYLFAPAGTTLAPVKMEPGTNLLNGAVVETSHPTQGNVDARSRITTKPEAGRPWNAYYGHNDGFSYPPEQRNLSQDSPWMSSSDAPNQWVRADMGSNQTISSVVVECPPMWGAYMTQLLQFTVETSTDLTTWTTAGTYHINPTSFYKLHEFTGANFAQGPSGSQYRRTRSLVWYRGQYHWPFNFTARSARYVRISIGLVGQGGGALDFEVASRMIGNAAASAGESWSRPVVRALEAYPNPLPFSVAEVEEVDPQPEGQVFLVIKP